MKEKSNASALVLMKALLFGKLKKGGKAVVKLEGKELVI